MHYNLPCKNMAGIHYEGGIREIFSRAGTLERSGKSIIHMEIGRPDFDSPERAKSAVIAALEKGNVHYTDMAGTYELRCEIAAKYKRDYGMSLDPDEEIVVSAGAMEALMTLFLTLLSPGDEVIVPVPYFAVYDDQIRMAGGVLKKVPCSLENDFRPQPEDIEAALTPRTRAIVINTPNNPTGATSTRSELEGIAAIAKKHDLLVVSDECYEKFVYDEDTPHMCIATLPGMRERTFTVSGASKTFSMTGWRVGWLVIPPETHKFVMKCHQAIATCANSFAQAGVAEALRSCQPDTDRMIREYKKRRDLMIEGLSKIDGIDVSTPKGAFYVFPSIKKLGVPSFEFCHRLLEEAGIATVPGQSFGVEDGYLRMAYCRTAEEIVEAQRRLAEFVKRL